MTMASPLAPPGPAFVAGIRHATGIQQTEQFDLAQLIAYHVPPRLPHESAERIADRMEAFADALRLGPPRAHPPYIGHRIRIRRGLPWLDYGDDQYRMCIFAAPRWARLVEAGRPVRVSVLLDPVEGGVSQEELSELTLASFARGSMRWGTTYHV